MMVIVFILVLLLIETREIKFSELFVFKINILMIYISHVLTINL